MVDPWGGGYHIYIYIYTHTYVYVGCMDVCMHACMYVCMSVFMYRIIISRIAIHRHK